MPRVMKNKWGDAMESRKEKRTLGERGISPRKWCDRALRVMIIKYTMNRDAGWRGLYGGCGGEKAEKMYGDEKHGITCPLYLQKSPVSPGHAT